MTKMNNYVEKHSKELFSYYPELTKKEDFDAFWAETIKQTKSVPLNPTITPYDYPSEFVDVYEISYNGFDETVIYGWYVVPKFTKKDKLPCIINYHGYKGNRGLPADFMQWATLGIAAISVDCRAQSGKTGNSAKYTTGNSQSVVSYGLLDKNEYYFRQVYMDCLKAIDYALTRPELDPNRIIINGGSQGGALGIAVCALDDRPFLCTVDVPSNSNLEQRVTRGEGAFDYVTKFLKYHPHLTDQVLDNLSYFDTMNMADKINCKVLASVGLQDPVCPAKWFFATYNRITSEKHIEIYPFNGHEGGWKVHNEIKLRFIMDNL